MSGEEISLDAEFAFMSVSNSIKGNSDADIENVIKFVAETSQIPREAISVEVIYQADPIIKITLPDVGFEMNIQYVHYFGEFRVASFYGCDLLEESLNGPMTVGILQLCGRHYAALARVAKIEEKYHMLKEHIKYAPGGAGAAEAHDHFDKNAT